MDDASPSPPGLLQRIRNWLRSDMLVLRWVFLTLYVVIVVGLFLWSWFWDADRLFLLIFGILTFGCQALFIFGGGTMHLSRPIRKRRLWMPILVAALMFGVLAGGLFLALGELFCLEDTLGGSPFWAFIAANWLVWFCVFFLATRSWRRMRVLGRITGALIAGSLAELLAASASHMIVSRRPGCLVGLYTMFGILAGLYVMLFAFGPGIALLFLRPRYRRELIEGPQEPELRWYQFSLRTMFLVMLAFGVASAWLGAGLEGARRNRRAAAEIHKVQARIERLGGSVGFHYQDHPDSLDELFGNPGVFDINEVDGQGAFGDAELKELGGLTRLESLRLHNTQVTDAGLRELRGLTRLESLQLSNTQVTDAGLKHLRGRTSLWKLNLAGTQVTDAGLEHLRGLTSLWKLNLAGTQVTDAGLEHLKGMTNLWNLNLTGTQVTGEGVKNLQQALPKCTIEHESAP